MGADEADVDDARVVMDDHDEPVLIASDVKNDSIVGEHTGGPVRARDVGWLCPVGFPGIRIPGAQRLLSIGVPFPAIPPRLSALLFLCKILGSSSVSFLSVWYLWCH